MVFIRPAFKKRINEILTMTKMIRQYYELVEKKNRFSYNFKIGTTIEIFRPI